MPTLAIISDAVFPYNKGGKETRIHEFSTGLVKLGWKVHIFTMQWWSGPTTKIEDGVTLHAICPKIALYSGKRRSIRGGIFFGFCVLKLVQLKNHFDLIEVDSMPYFPVLSAKLVALIKNRPLIAIWHEVWSKDYWRKYLGMLGFAGFLLESFSAKLPDLIITDSDLTKRRVNKFYTKPAPNIVIGDGVHFDVINTVYSKKFESDIIFVGRLLDHKNVSLLIEAIKIVSIKRNKIKVAIVGDGPEKDSLIELVTKYKLNRNIVFYGFLPNSSEVYAYMHSSKILVLPSEREGFGLVILEANACGIPAITVNSSENAAQDLITQGKNGFVVAQNASAIASAIENMLEGDTYKTMKATCLSIAKSFDWLSQVIRLDKKYREILESY